jgi:hypothetical protein
MRNLLYSFYLILSILLIVLVGRYIAFGAGNLFHILLTTAAVWFSFAWVFEKDVA